MSPMRRVEKGSGLQGRATNCSNSTLHILSHCNHTTSNSMESSNGSNNWMDHPPTTTSRSLNQCNSNKEDGNMTQNAHKRCVSPFHNHPSSLWRMVPHNTRGRLQANWVRSSQGSEHHHHQQRLTSRGPKRRLHKQCPGAAWREYASTSRISLLKCAW